MGCATKLVVHRVDPDSDEVSGIRVLSPVSYVVTRKIVTENCRERTEDEIVHLPAGEPYEINFDPGLFAKSEFSVSFSDNGVLKQVALNSTPQATETIKALGELTGKLTAAGLVPLVEGAAKVDCGAVLSDKIIDVRRLELSE